NPPIQFVHEDDVVRAIHRIVKLECTGVFNIAGDGALTLARIAELADRTLIRLPASILRAIAGMAWRMGWTSISEAPPGFVDFLCFPWCVANVKLKTEVGFLFKYDTLRAYMDFLETRAERRGERPARVRVEVDADDLDELEAVDEDLEGKAGSSDD